MQGKGIVKFFLVVVSLMCIIQYFYLYPTAQVEENAEEYAEEVTQNTPEEGKKEVYNLAVAAYLDSMGNEQVFKMPLLPGYTYNELKQKQLALGLDLKGGMSVVLQVDLRDFIRKLAKNSKDPTLIEALKNASAAQSGAQDNYIALFADEFQKAAQANAVDGKVKKLAHIFSRNSSLEDIDFETSDDKVEAILRQKANETVELTYLRLKDRIDEIGVVQPNVNLDAARDLILVELPGISNPERARKFLATAAKLEFWNVFRITDNSEKGRIIDLLVEADNRLKNIVGSSTDEVVQTPSFAIDTTYVVDSLGNETTEIASIDSIDTALNDPLANAGPLFKNFTLNAAVGGGTAFGPAVMGIAAGNQINSINDMLSKSKRCVSS